MVYNLWAESLFTFSEDFPILNSSLVVLKGHTSSLVNITVTYFIECLKTNKLAFVSQQHRNGLRKIRQL